MSECLVARAGFCYLVFAESIGSLWGVWFEVGRRTEFRCQMGDRVAGYCLVREK